MLDIETLIHAALISMVQECGGCVEIPRDDIKKAMDGSTDLLVELADGVLVIRAVAHSEMMGRLMGLMNKEQNATDTTNDDAEFLRSLGIKKP